MAQPRFSILKNSLWLMFASFLLWIYCFRGFVFNQLTLVADALPYYEHVKFYIDNISAGIYPLWDTGRGPGVPSDFYMRRIGAYNPFLLSIVFLNKTGLLHVHSYLIFLVLYFFLGMLGFYKTAQMLLKDDRAAFLAFSLLLFSSLGTRLFASYIILVFVPLVWFFVFLMKFLRRPAKDSFLGIIFTLMILIVTYIPFYFFTIFVTFIISAACVYWKEAGEACRKFFTFMRANKTFTCICAGILLFSMIPGIIFFQDSSKDEMILTARQQKDGHLLSVKRERDEPSFLAHYQPRQVFSNLKEIHLGIFYIPLFGYMLLVLGAWAGINRRLIFLSAWACLLVLIGFPNASAIYPFLQKYVFYFKYIRNLRFFFWIAVLPIGILFVCETFSQLFNSLTAASRKKTGAMIALSFVHAGFFIFLLMKENVILSSYVTVVLSYLLFMAICCRPRWAVPALSWVLLACAATQPLEVYAYLNKNALKKFKGPGYKGGYYYDSMNHVSGDHPDQYSFTSGILMYYSPRWHNLLVQNSDYRSYDHYFKHRLRLVDQVQYINKGEGYFEQLDYILKNNTNSALVSDDEISGIRSNGLVRKNKEAEILKSGHPAVAPLKFNVNEYSFRLKLQHDKFLIYNNAFHSGWHAFVDGREVPIHRTNFAYQGIWIPKGEHTVTFRYGTYWDYVRHYGLIIIFIGTFVSLVYLMYTRKNFEKVEA